MTFAPTSPSTAPDYVPPRGECSNPVPLSPPNHRLPRPSWLACLTVPAGDVHGIGLAPAAVPAHRRAALLQGPEAAVPSAGAVFHEDDSGNLRTAAAVGVLCTPRIHNFGTGGIGVEAKPQH